MYQIEVTEKQAQIISEATELYARIQAGQLGEVALYIPRSRLDHIQVVRDALREAELHFTGMAPGAYFGITNSDIRDAARIAWDLSQVVRHRLAWDRNPEGDYMSVHFDEPRNLSTTQALAEIRRVEANG